MANSWIHNTSGRGPHAGGSTPQVTMHFLNDYYDTVPGHGQLDRCGVPVALGGAWTANVATPQVGTFPLAQPVRSTSGGASRSEIQIACCALRANRRMMDS